MLFQFDIGGRGRIIPEYSYNWPYDYCSLVELAKIDAEVKFEKVKFYLSKASNET